MGTSESRAVEETSLIVVVRPGRALAPELSRALVGAGAPGLDDVPGMGAGSGEPGNANGSSECEAVAAADAPPGARREFSDLFCEALSLALPRLIPRELAMAALKDDLTEPLKACQ